MERSLIKYDLRKMLKVLSVYFILSIFVGAIARLFGQFDNMAIMRVLYIIFSSLEYSIWGAILVQTFVRIILRFNLNFYGDESYLTHTLPVTKNQLLLSKYISGFITILSSVLVLSISVFIMFYSKINIKNLKNLLEISANGLNVSTTLFITLIILTIFVEICAIMSMCFSGIIIGKRFNTKKTWKSILFIAIFYFASIILLLLIALIFFACMGNVNALFANKISGKNLTYLFTIAIITYFIIAIIFYFVSKWQFEKGVNVD